MQNEVDRYLNGDMSREMMDGQKFEQSKILRDEGVDSTYIHAEVEGRYPHVGTVEAPRVEEVAGVHRQPLQHSAIVEARPVAGVEWTFSPEGFITEHLEGGAA